MSQSHTFQSTPSAAPLWAKLFIKMLERLKHGNLQLITPEGNLYMFGDLHQPPSAVLKINDWRACLRIMLAGDIGFAEAIELGWAESPDLTALLRMAIRNEAILQQAMHGTWLSKLVFRLRHLLRPNSKSGSRKNIHAHYDLGNSFYERWLDPSMTYSSAVFDGDYRQTLQQAQAAKYQRIIDSLGLQVGDHVLEIGCGWGGFAEHAAQQGIRVTGVTISQAQFDYAKQRLATYGDLTRIELCDYRDLSGQYDAIVSIEMFEAVGERYWPDYFAQLKCRLRPGGRALVQSITINRADFERYRLSSDFIQEYIFPGGMLPSPERFGELAVEHGMAVTDQYHFGLDYAETLRRWRALWEQQLNEIIAQGFDQRFLRIWRMYFAYCEAGFDERKTDVVQFLLCKN